MAAATIVTAALVAVGCGSDDGAGAGAGDSGLVGGDGPLAWLPADTWLVASVNADADAIDEAVETLDRLPAWALAEGFLPASDGAGLRRALLERLARQGSDAQDRPDAKLDAAELERAFGDRAGIAITSADFEQLQGERPPLAMWIEVDDPETAADVMRRAIPGELREQSHEGITYHASRSRGANDGAFLVEGGLLVVTPTGEQLEALIDAREGGDSLADDDTARAVIEASLGDALAGAVVQSTPLLEAAPDLAARAAAEADDPADRAHGGAVAERLGPALGTDGVRDLLPDWSGGSITIDETGLVMRGAWSNPRELAEPEVGARDLVERAPADAPVAQAMVSDGTSLARVQRAWAEARDAADLDLEALAAGCAPARAWLCDLGIATALTVLEDEALAEAVEEAGDTSFLMVQDIAPLLALATQLEAAEAARTPAPRLDTRIWEFATSGDAPDWRPPADLRRAAARAGLAVSAADDWTKLTVRITPGSPLARAVQQADAETLAAARLFGFDLHRLATPAGVTFTAEEVDGLHVGGVPQDAPSRLAASLRGDADTLGDSQHYAAAVDAVGVPDEVGTYGFVDVRGYVESLFAALGEAEPEVQRILPTVRNNLADVPGLVFWSTREEFDGHEVGVYEAVLPILD